MLKRRQQSLIVGGQHRFFVVSCIPNKGQRLGLAQGSLLGELSRGENWRKIMIVHNDGDVMEQC